MVKKYTKDLIIYFGLFLVYIKINRTISLKYVTSRNIFVLCWNKRKAMNEKSFCLITTLMISINEYWMTLSFVHFCLFVLFLIWYKYPHKYADCHIIKEAYMIRIVAVAYSLQNKERFIWKSLICVPKSN